MNCSLALQWRPTVKKDMYPSLPQPRLTAQWKAASTKSQLLGLLGIPCEGRTTSRFSRLLLCQRGGASLPAARAGGSPQPPALPWARPFPQLLLMMVPREGHHLSTSSITSSITKTSATSLSPSQPPPPSLSPRGTNQGPGCRGRNG